MPPLVEGLRIGFLIAVPVGPIGMLCLRRTLTDGRRAGFVSGLGAAAADACYGLIAALGLTAVAAALTAAQRPLQFIGALFLLWLGGKIFRAPAPDTGTIAGQDHLRLGRAFVTTFLLTLANPMTIASFAVVFAGFGLAASLDSAFSAVLLVAGVFFGSAAWWLILSFSADAARHRLNAPRLRLINRAAGLVILGFGVWQLLQLYLRP